MEVIMSVAICSRINFDKRIKGGRSIHQVIMSIDRTSTTHMTCSASGVRLQHVNTRRQKF